MVELKVLRLWLSDTGRMVCENESCAGPELLARIEASAALQNMLRVGGEAFHVMNPSDLAEMAALLGAQGKSLACDKGHVYYDAQSQSLQPKGMYS